MTQKVTQLLSKSGEIRPDLTSWQQPKNVGVVHAASPLTGGKTTKNARFEGACDMVAEDRNGRCNPTWAYAARASSYA